MTPDKTLILVTHRMQLLSLTQRLIVMNNGRIALDGPTGEVLAKLRGPAAPAPQKIAQGAEG
jgi:ATP-binding cassette subfamily C protein LapB